MYSPFSIPDCLMQYAELCVGARHFVLFYGTSEWGLPRRHEFETSFVYLYDMLKEQRMITHYVPAFQEAIAAVEEVLGLASPENKQLVLKQEVAREEAEDLAWEACGDGDTRGTTLEERKRRERRRKKQWPHQVSEQKKEERQKEEEYVEEEEEEEEEEDPPETVRKKRGRDQKAKCYVERAGSDDGGSDDDGDDEAYEDVDQDSSEEEGSDGDYVEEEFVAKV